MITETIVINKIIADEGKILTDGKDTFGKVIFLGSNSSAEDFYEITEEEYEEILKEQEESEVE